MNNTTPVRSTCGRQLSAGLKERLKRSGRYHFTPPSAKRQCVSGRESDNVVHVISPSQNPLEQSSLDISETMPISKPVPINKLPLDDAAQTESPLMQSGGDNSAYSNSTSRKCFSSRRVSTSLCFKSPIAQNVQPVERDCDSPEAISSTRRPVHSPGLAAMPCDVMESPLSAHTPVSANLKVDAKRGLKSKLNFCDDGDDSGTKDDERAFSPVCKDADELRREKIELSRELAAAEEKLRKLKMVKMYRSKNNLDELEKLIEKWRSVSQRAVTDLHNMVPEPRPSLFTFVQHLQIDAHLLQLDVDEES